MKSRSIKYGAFFFHLSNFTVQRLTLLPHILKELNANQLLEHEADDSPLCNAEIRNDGAIPPFCGLVVRVHGYRSRGPGFDSQRYQIF
jgi:hypothetical protein